MRKNNKYIDKYINILIIFIISITFNIIYFNDSDINNDNNNNDNNNNNIKNDNNNKKNNNNNNDIKMKNK